MPDREKVLKGLDICANGSGCKDGIPNPCCPYASEIGCDLNQILLDALALLKEQEAEIDEISDEYIDLGKEIAKRPDVIMCKDCKHGKPCNDVEINCEKDIGTFKTTVHSRYWFCADCERS